MQGTHGYLINPCAWNCEQNEDFIGRISRVSRHVSTRLTIYTVRSSAMELLSRLDCGGWSKEEGDSEHNLINLKVCHSDPLRHFEVLLAL